MVSCFFSFPAPMFFVVVSSCEDILVAVVCIPGICWRNKRRDFK